MLVNQVILTLGACGVITRSGSVTQTSPLSRSIVNLRLWVKSDIACEGYVEKSPTFLMLREACS